MTDRVLVSDAVLAAYSSAIRLGGIPYALLPENHEGALTMLAATLDLSLGVMRYLALTTGHTDADLMMMMKTWSEIRLTEQLDALYGEPE